MDSTDIQQSTNAARVKNLFNNQLEDRPAGDSTTNLNVDAGTILESKATATTGERPTSCGDGDDGTLIDGVAHCNSDSVWVGHNLSVLARAREREKTRVGATTSTVTVTDCGRSADLPRLSIYSATISRAGIQIHQR